MTPSVHPVLPAPLDEATSRKIAAFGLVCAFFVTMVHSGQPAPRDPAQADWWFFRMTAGVFGRLAVPFYFAVAGFFLARRAGEPGWWKRAVGKRWHTLALPYLFWLAVWDVFAVLLAMQGNWRAGTGLWTGLPAGWDALAFAGLHPFREPFSVSLWFLRSLLLFVLASPLLFRLLRRSGAGVPALLFALSVGCLSGVLPAWADGLANRFVSVQGLSFFAAGAWLALAGARLPEGRLAAVAGGAGFAGLVFSRWMLARGMAGADAVHAFFLPAALLGAWRAMPAVRWPKRLTDCTFAVYLLHVFVLRLLLVAIYGKTGCAVLVFKYLSGFGVALAAALALHRFFPRFSSFAFGGR